MGLFISITHGIKFEALKIICYSCVNKNDVKPMHDVSCGHGFPKNSNRSIYIYISVLLKNYVKIKDL